VTALRILQNALAQLEALQGRVGLVRSAADLQGCLPGNPPAVLLSLEGADPLAGRLELLEIFHRLGLRSIGLTHNHNSVAAGGCAPPDNVHVGLTEFGRALIPAMNGLGMLIDTAHLGRGAFDEVLALSKAPVVNSHSCCRSFVDLERNLDDRQLHDLAACGGLAAITYVPKFLTQDTRTVTSIDVFRHLEHMVEIAGEDHVGLGSDFDGVELLPEDLPDPRGTPALVEQMIGAGWSEVRIAKILGKNWLRVLGQVLMK
jgi:membrane dipeptidase